MRLRVKPEPGEEAGAEESQRGRVGVRRHVRSQRPLPPSTESSGSTASEGVAGARSRPGLCQQLRPPQLLLVLPAPSARPRPQAAAPPSIVAVSRAGKAGGAVPASCPPLGRLLPLALLPLTSSLSPSLAAASGALGGTERERGRGWMVLGADEGSLAGLPLFTGP